MTLTDLEYRCAKKTSCPKNGKQAHYGSPFTTHGIGAINILPGSICQY